MKTKTNARSTIKGKVQHKPSDQATKLPDAPVEFREQLYNGGEIGPITQVQLAEAEITSLGGIMLDLDPKLFRREVVPDTIAKNPRSFTSRSSPTG